MAAVRKDRYDDRHVKQMVCTATLLMIVYLVIKGLWLNILILFWYHDQVSFILPVNSSSQESRWCYLECRHVYPDIVEKNKQTKEKLMGNETIQPVLDKYKL
jgi:uncharacterized membrane protein YccF (DUF307 family)